MDNTSLEKYKPQVDLSKVFEIDETLEDNKLCFEIHKKIVTARKIQDATFLGIGKMLKIFRDRKLYKFHDFDNFEQYLASEEISFSREKAYLYIRIYEMFIVRFQLEPSEMSKLGVVRLMMLAPLLKETLDRQEALDKIEEYANLRYGDFVKKIKTTINVDGKPNMYWSEETNSWIVQFFEDKTKLINMGKWVDRKDDN